MLKPTQPAAVDCAAAVPLYNQVSLVPQHQGRQVDPEFQQEYMQQMSEQLCQERSYRMLAARQPEIPPSGCLQLAILLAI
jgi:hypothetical protein